MPQIIYMITCTVTGKSYIGQTAFSLAKRWKQHVNKANSSQFESMIISRAIKKYGKGKFKIKTLVELPETATQEDVDQAEIKAIAEFSTLAPNGYNQALGGKVIKHSEDTRKKVRQAQVSHWESLTEEERDQKLTKMRTERNKVGTKFTREGLQRKKDYQKSRWTNDEQYQTAMEQNLVKARKAAHTPEAEKRKGASLVKNRRYKLTSPTGEVFEVNGLHQFAIEHSLDASSLQKVAKGKLKHYKQWQCECIDDSGIRPERHDAYLKLKRYELTSPDGIQFCTYGLTHMKELFDLDSNSLARVARKGYCHKNWSIQGF
jgi:group I intron endonuclease